MNRFQIICSMSLLSLTSLAGCANRNASEDSQGDASSTQETGSAPTSGDNDSTDTEDEVTPKTQDPGTEDNTGDEDKPGDEDKTGDKDKGDDSDDGDDNGTKALGALCSESKECKSGVCRDIEALGDDGPETIRTCSLCGSDKTCTDEKLGLACLPNLKLEGAKPLVYHDCLQGDLGERCKKDAHCEQDTFCVKFIDIGGNELQTCSSCRNDDDCSGDTPVCLPVIEGHFQCKAEGSIPDGLFCSLGSSGDKGCENYCTEVEDGDLPDGIGICGACRKDEHCDDGESCQDAKKGLIIEPAKCVED